MYVKQSKFHTRYVYEIEHFKLLLLQKGYYKHVCFFNVLLQTQYL